MRSRYRRTHIQHNHRSLHSAAYISLFRKNYKHYQRVHIPGHSLPLRYSHILRMDCRYIFYNQYHKDKMPHQMYGYSRYRSLSCILHRYRLWQYLRGKTEKSFILGQALAGYIGIVQSLSIFVYPFFLHHSSVVRQASTKSAV